MTASTTSSWQHARKAPFEAFGILYYPVFRNHADLPTTLDDADMAWAVTADANLEGTGYTLSQASVLTLAAVHHALADLSRGSLLLPLADLAQNAIDPLADLKRLVPDVKAAPMYPDFPQQVMEMSEAQFRYEQQLHYFSTYGVEYIAGLMGLDVTVGEGWMPDVEATPKTEEDETLVAPKVLHLLATAEDLQAVVTARLARATRMHPAEISTTLMALCDPQGDLEQFPKVAFHENMMELVRAAAQQDSATLERVAAGFAQHPGDLLKMTMFLLEASRANHLTTRQKKGLCRAFEHFEARPIARNIADAGRKARLATNFLSVERFGGAHLREAIELVETRQVRSWTSELEELWNGVSPLALRDLWPGKREERWKALLAHYGRRPGILLRSLGRLLKAGCPVELVSAEATAHAEIYSLPTLVTTLSALSNSFEAARDPLTGRRRLPQRKARAGHDVKAMDRTTCDKLVVLLRELASLHMRAMETPLKGKQVFLDMAGISLASSVLMPNEVGETGTAWPPVGIAFDLPADKTLRFFTFWDDRSTRVDVDLHFTGRKTTGESFHVGWNASFKRSGMVTSGDITTSHNSVEYLDIDMAVARAHDVAYVVQQQHIFAGRSNWGNIKTCYSGALLVSTTSRSVRLYKSENLLFRDDLTGKGRMMDYAVINVPNHYVRILRGAALPIGDLAFSLKDYLDDLFEAQEVTLVETPEEAEVRVCVGRSDDPQVVSLFDVGFFLG